MPAVSGPYTYSILYSVCENERKGRNTETEKTSWSKVETVLYGNGLRLGKERKPWIQVQLGAQSFPHTIADDVGTKEGLIPQEHSPPSRRKL